MRCLIRASGHSRACTPSTELHSMIDRQTFNTLRLYAAARRCMRWRWTHGEKKDNHDPNFRSATRE